jgi:hypothetical protein
MGFLKQEMYRAGMVGASWLGVQPALEGRSSFISTRRPGERRDPYSAAVGRGGRGDTEIVARALPGYEVALPPQNQPVEPARERGRILRQFAVENLRLFKKQERQIA